MALKILHVTPSFPPDIGGVANHVFNLCTHLREMGSSVSVICPKRLRANFSKTSGPGLERINSLYLPGWPYPTLRSVSIPIDLGNKLRSLVGSGKFDVIHTHGHHYPLSWIAIKAARKHNVPVVLTLHGTFALNPYVVGGYSKVEAILNKAFFARIFKMTSAVIGLTSKITDYGKTLGGSSTKYVTIPNGINTEIYVKNFERRMEYRRKYALDDNSIVVLFRGRFEHVKGIIEFVESAISLIKETTDNIEVVIIGGGTLEEKVRTMTLSTDRIHLFGWQNVNQIHELYLASNIFMLPSRFEALPITIIEAMNAGLHIAYTDVGGVSDILEGYDMKTKLDNVDPTYLKKALALIVNDLSLNVNEHTKSISYARKFDWKDVSIKISELYKNVSS